MKSNKGFTIIEGMVALMTFSIISTICINLINSPLDNYYFDKEVEQLKIDIINTGQSALKSSSKCSIKFNDENYIIKCNEQNEQINLSSIINISTNFKDNSLYFNDNGNVSQAGTIDVASKNENAELKVMIGSGYVTK